MMECTWKLKDEHKCLSNATYEQTGRDGEVWAVLCRHHNDLLQDAIDGSDVKKMLRFWVAANGGAERMASTR